MNPPSTSTAPAWRPATPAWAADVLRGRVARNIASNSVATAIGCFVQLGALVALSHLLVPAVYAQYLLAAAAIGVAEVACDFGARIWTKREVAGGTPGGWVLGNALSAKLAYGAATAIIFTAWPWFGFTLADRLLLAAIAITQPSADLATWFLRGRDRLDIEAAVTLVYRCAVAVVLVVAALAADQILVLLVAWLACNVVRTLATLPLLRRFVTGGMAMGAEPPRPLALTSLIVQTAPLGTTILIAALFHRTGVLWLGAFAGDQDVAAFGTAHKVISTATLVATSVALGFYPRLVAAARSGASGEVNAILRRQAGLLAVLFAPLSIAGAFVLPRVLPAAFGEVGDLTRLSVLLLPGLYLAAINIGSKFTLNALGMDWRDALSFVAGGVGFVVAYAAFAGWQPAEAAAIAWAFSEATLLLARRVWLAQGAPGVRTCVSLTTGGLAAVMIACSAGLAVL